MDFEATVLSEENRITIFFSGRLNVSNSNEADEILLSAVDEGKDIVLDLEGLEYISSAGLRTIKRLVKATKDNGTALSVRNVNNNIMDVLDMTGFTAMLTFE